MKRNLTISDNGSVALFHNAKRIITFEEKNVLILVRKEKSRKRKEITFKFSMQELSAKFTITDIEYKFDKYQNPFYLLHLENSNHAKGYAFHNSLASQTLETLNNNPNQFINCRVKITYSLNQAIDRTFLQVKAIEAIV